MKTSQAVEVPKGGVIVNSHGLNLLTKRGFWGMIFCPGKWGTE
jgi:hypothetical protein